MLIKWKNGFNMIKWKCEWIYDENEDKDKDKFSYF
jgi:hypothetical protein